MDRAQTVLRERPPRQGQSWRSAVGLMGVLWAGAAEADTVVDATLPLVIASSEITAMGGAGLGFASGAAGLNYTPSAPALRRITDTGPNGVSAVLSTFWSINEEDADLTNAGVRFTGDNSELLVDTGVTGRIGRLGAGLGVSGLQVWSADALARIGDSRLALAVGALDGRVASGLAARVMWVEVQQGDSRQVFMGVGGEAGLSFAPEDRSLRLGLSARTPITAAPDGETALGIDAVRLPWQLAIGGGWANAAARDSVTGGHGARLGVDVVAYGRVPEGVSLAPALAGELVPRGRSVSVSPRIGGELEALPERLRLRAGTYVEPSRVTWRDPRHHWTAGLECRLLHVQMLWGLIDHDISLQSAFDVAERYQRLGWLGLSVWNTGWVSPADPANPPSEHTGPEGAQ